MPSLFATRLRNRQKAQREPSGRLIISFLIGAFLAVGIALKAQQQPTPSVQSKPVTVYTTVRDKHGKIAANLKKENFALDEGGRPQIISAFARGTDLPITLGLLVDTSASQSRFLDDERKASYAFLDRILRQDKDRAFIIHFDAEVELLRDLTASREKLQSAFALLQTAQEDQADGEGSPDEHDQRGPLLFDGIYLASDELMRKQQGRKALIILSDGVNKGSRESLDDAIESAQRSDTVIYSILYSDEEEPEQTKRHGHWNAGAGGMGWPGGGDWPSDGGSTGGRTRPYPQGDKADGKRNLESISTETGGRLFQTSKKLTVDQIYTQIEEDLTNQYILGYVSDSPTAVPGYHQIHLTTNQKDLTVQARDGYYSRP